MHEKEPAARGRNLGRGGCVQGHYDVIVATVAPQSLHQGSLAHAPGPAENNQLRLLHRFQFHLFATFLIVYLVFMVAKTFSKYKLCEWTLLYIIIY